MKISIITVVFNNVSTLESALDSVELQTYDNIEHIVIDGGSTDGTLDILKNRSDRIQQIISEPDNGIYDAMNKGISLATGDVIGILNSDDLYYDNNVIKNVMHYFNEDPELDILYGDLLYVKSTNTDKIVRNWISRPYYTKFFENGNVPPHPTLFLKHHIYTQVGHFNLEFRLASDYEFMLRLFKKFNYKSKYINCYLVKMRLGGATNKNFKNILNGNVEIISAWRLNNLILPFNFIPMKIAKRLMQFVKIKYRL